jgi:hypothetical protein
MTDLFQFQSTPATETATKKTVKGLADLIAALEAQPDSKDTVAFARELLRQIQMVFVL